MPPEASEVRRLEYLRLDELHFDPDNPRFPSLRHGSDREAVLAWLLDSANLPDLMRSIATQDFFPGEPLLVSPQDEGGYRVVEGNRRYAACWLLSRPEDAPTKRRTVAAIAESANFRPQELPCLILPEAEILGFLGYRHITGIQEWSPLAKARYLDRLWDDDSGPDDWDERLRWLASKIGSRSDYVARLLTALAIFELIESKQFFHIPNLNEETLSFSLLALALNRPTLATYIGLDSGQSFDFEALDENNLEHLTRWFFERDESGRTTLGESRNVSVLVAVLEDEDARQLLESGASLQRAYRLVSAVRESIADFLRQALEPLAAAADALSSRSGVPMDGAEEVLGAIDDRLAIVRAGIAEIRS